MASRRTTSSSDHAAARQRKKLERLEDWGKWEPCGWCGKHYCVNNYRDRRVRRKKYKNRYICAMCLDRVRGNPEVQRMMKLLEALENTGCLKQLVRTGKPALNGKGQLMREGTVWSSSCKCVACRVHDFMVNGDWTK